MTSLRIGHSKRPAILADLLGGKRPPAAVALHGRRERGRVYRAAVMARIPNYAAGSKSRPEGFSREDAEGIISENKRKMIELDK